MKRWLPLIVMLCAALAAGCGQDDNAAKQTAARQEQARTLAKVRAAEARDAAVRKERRKARALEAQAECTATFKPLMTSLGNLGSRLSVGLAYADYTTRVGNVKVRYDDIDMSSVGDARCLGHVGVPAESALNHYIKALSRWSKCFQSIDCSTDSIEGYLQKQWSAATVNLLRAKDGLRRMAIPV